jgi:hypothetical protein
MNSKYALQICHPRYQIFSATAEEQDGPTVTLLVVGNTRESAVWIVVGASMRHIALEHHKNKTKQNKTFSLCAPFMIHILSSCGSLRRLRISTVIRSCAQAPEGSARTGRKLLRLLLCSSGPQMN